MTQLSGGREPHEEPILTGIWPRYGLCLSYVATAPNGTPQPNCCEPGDFTVTKIPSGYLIGRAMAQLGPGPWWEYVAIVTQRRQALDHARQLAYREGTRAWLHKAGDDYEPLD